MARTLKGNYTGAAARIDRSEKFDEMIHNAIQAGKDAQREYDENLDLDLGDAMAELRQLDPIGWEEWFDNDDNVPAVGYREERLIIIRERVSNLRLTLQDNIVIMDEEIRNEEAGIDLIDQIGDAKLCSKFGSSL